MRILNITSQHRSDFRAEVQCEHCLTKVPNWSGYDDYNYHANVMPKFHCKACGKNRAGALKTPEST